MEWKVHYDLKKLHAKQLVQKLGNSHKYAPAASGLSALAALTLLREKVISLSILALLAPKTSPSCTASTAPWIAIADATRRGTADGL